MPYWLRRLSADVRAGRCSGFPECCIAFFCTGWRLMYGRNVPMSEKPRWRTRMLSWYSRKANHAGYVPCPLCLISGARVAVRECTVECGHREEIQALVREKHPDAKFH